MGKVVTIFYAILGIPLMLLCLSNIGDVMATSFRFLYWRVCCYVCTKKPKRRRHRSVRGSTRSQSGRPHTRSRSLSVKKPARYSQKSADSGYPFSEGMPSHSYSDTDLRYNDDMPRSRLQNLRESQMSRYSDSATTPMQQSHGRGRGFARNLEPIPSYGRGLNHGRTGTLRSGKIASATPSPRDSDKRRKRSSSEARAFPLDVDDRPVAKSAILFNKYAIEDEVQLPRRGKSIQSPLDNLDLDEEYPSTSLRSKSLPRQPRRDFFLDDVATGAIPSRRRSPMLDKEPRDFRNYRDRDYDDRDYRSNREGDVFTARDFMEADMGNVDKDNMLMYGIEMDDLSNQRYRTRRSPEPGRAMKPDRTTSLDRRNRYRSDRYSDDEDDNIPYYLEDPEIMNETDIATHRAARQRKKEKMNAPSARIMSPMGVSVHRQARYMEDFDIEYAYDDGSFQTSKTQIKPVPIWLCVFLVVFYIIAGAFLFSSWENWSFLDSAYFCFITLTTIGFGDFVPAQGVKADSEISIALCSLYLLFGISLLAMSFNLVQEEVIANVRSVAKRLGIIKPELGEESEDDE